MRSFSRVHNNLPVASSVDVCLLILWPWRSAFTVLCLVVLFLRLCALGFVPSLVPFPSILRCICLRPFRAALSRLLACPFFSLPPLPTPPLSWLVAALPCRLLSSRFSLRPSQQTPQLKPYSSYPFILTK